MQPGAEVPVSVLYVSYDGILEPLGESQVLSYLERLASDMSIALLSYEKPSDLSDTSRVTAMEQRLARRGILWLRLRYSTWPPALSTAWDVCRGIVRARRHCADVRVRVLHARSYVSSLVALGARSASGARFLFDMRGFWVDEKVEAGHWRRDGVLVRVGRFWERRFLRTADAIVSLTHAAVPLLPALGFNRQASVPVEVIPTCVDLERFTPRPKDSVLLQALGLTGYVVAGSIGTLSNRYLRWETLTYLARLAQRRSDVRILFVTREDHDALRRDALASGLPDDRLVVAAATFTDMPQFVALFDVGVFFIPPKLSTQAMAATKLAEFLACGVPVVIHDGVGDAGRIVRERRVGIALPSVDTGTIDMSLSQLNDVLADPDLARRCREAAEQLFDVQTGVTRYRALYNRLAGRD